MQRRALKRLAELMIGAAVVVSGIAAVYAKHETRKLYTELQALQQERDQLEMEWGQLQIEQSTWAQHARIEQVATDDLSLVRPAATEIFVIERP